MSGGSNRIIEVLYHSVLIFFLGLVQFVEVTRSFTGQI